MVRDASLLLCNSWVNQMYWGEVSAQEKVPPDIIVKAHMTRASGGV
jgi:hypothetical protein